MSEYATPDSSPCEVSIAYFGTGSLGVPTLETLIAHRVPVALVVTAPDRPAGRGRKISDSPIKKCARQAGLPVLQPADVNDPYVRAQIRNYQCDLGLIVAYGQKLGEPLIQQFPKGIINLHASLLPKYRGAAPINWTILNGDRETGLTVMQINDQIDAGEILDQRRVPIGPLERADELHDRLADLGGPMVLDVLHRLQAGSITPTAQDPSQASRAPKLSKQLSQIDWRRPAEELVHQVLGLWPWPAAKSWYRPEHGNPVQVALARAEPLRNDRQSSLPGTVLADFSVACGSGRLGVIELQPAGKKLMSWQDFIHGRHVQPGDRFVASAHVPNGERP